MSHVNSCPSLSKVPLLSGLVFIVFFLSACAGSPYATWSLRNALEEVRSENRTNLLKLQVGMTKTEVLQIMGTQEDKLWGGVGYPQRISNPFRAETLEGKDGTLEVLYYYTDLQKQDGAVTDDELTPLVLKNNKLVGWGRSALNESVTKYEIRVR